MKRRTVLKSLAAVAVARPLVDFELLAQAPTITDANIPTLIAIAEVTLPSALGAAGRRKAVDRFVAWVRNYKEGADTGHGYGSSTLSRPTGPAPTGTYPAQFAALDAAAKDAGGASFAALPLDNRRAIVEQRLNTPQPLTRLPARPNGANLVADFMGYYFSSADARDLAYQAQIGRDSCRSLDGSDQPPAPLVGSDRGQTGVRPVSDRGQTGARAVPGPGRPGAEVESER